jgi:hypothetical protein
VDKHTSDSLVAPFFWGWGLVGVFGVLAFCLGALLGPEETGPLGGVVFLVPPSSFAGLVWGVGVVVF